MSQLSPQQSDLIKSIKFANEFLKITRGFKTEADRPDGLPQDLKEHLANEHLNAMIKDYDLEPEMLVWGMLHMIEILLKFADLDPEDLTDVMDRFVDYVKDNPDQYGGETS